MAGMVATLLILPVTIIVMIAARGAVGAVIAAIVIAMGAMIAA